MALQPPSFFQAPSNTSQQQPEEAKQLPAAQEPLTTHSQPCARPFLPAGAGLPGQHAAFLTNDLLAVEAHLQSRLRLLEEEKKNLISRMVELEKSLVEQKEERKAELDTLITRHSQSLLQAQLEVKQLSAECQRLREEGEGRAAELERDLKASEEHHCRELDRLTAKSREQEAHAEALALELEEERQSCGNKLNQLREQLATATSEQQRLRTELEGQLRSVSDELRLSRGRLHELEGYLGGEVPELPTGKDGRSLTWREERENLQSIIAVLEHDLHKMKSEDKLLNIRLTSLMEILSIQETTIAKQGCASVSGGSGVGEKDSESAAALRILLTRWREKVFVMLVQQKLQQIHNSRSRHEASQKEAELIEQIQRVEREKELLTHSLADRSAELQLQMSKTNLAEQRLGESLEATHHLQCQVQAQKDHLSCVAARIQSMVEAQGSYVANFNQAMTRMANCDHRLSMMSGRTNSTKATLNYQRAIQQRGIAVRHVDCCVQTESDNGESGEVQDLASLPRAQLIGEVQSLSQERSSLVRQLQESTATFEQQLDTLNSTWSTKLATAEAQLSSMQRENCSLNEELSQLKNESEVLMEKEEELTLRVEDLESELREAKTTVETRVDIALREQQQLNNEGMAEMEKLLSVARREHGKAVVQLQQLQRQLGRDRDRAMEAMTLNQTRLEQQLEDCRKKLQATQVERNLLLTTLRQEGAVVPVKQRSSPRKGTSSDANVEEREERSSEQSESSQDDERHSENSFAEEESQPSTSRLSEHEQQLPDHDVHSQDIREVLKDLQMLSASLLGMETQQTAVTTDQHSKH